MRYLWYGSLLVAATLAAQIDLAGQHGAQLAAWTQPFPPFAITGNLYYVGSKALASYLVTTSQGHVLINSSLEESVPLIRASVEKLGFKFSDIKVLLISHAHWDHNAGSAAVKAATGARYMVMDADVATVESGGKADFQYGNDPATHYPATKVDRVLEDGDEVRLGDAVLVAHLTPGHTKGCTTWTIKVQEGGRSYNAVIIGSAQVNDGYQLLNNAKYPGIAADYERTFKVLKSLPADIFLGSHGFFFELETKYARLQQGAGSAFVDPQGYQTYVADREQAFKAALAKEKPRIERIGKARRAESGQGAGSKTALMQFTRRLREGIRRGRIKSTVRIWTRPHVKVGGRYQMDDGHVVVDSIETMRLTDITYDLARESGFENVKELLQVARHGSGNKVYLIRFHYLPPGGWDVPRSTAGA